MGITRILYCIDRIVRGGTESQLAGLINRLDRNRFAPYLCTLRPSESLIAEVDCPKLELGTQRLFSPSGFARLLRLSRFLRREEIQIVQTFFQDSTILGIPAARLAGVPVRLIAFRDLGFWRNPRQQFLMRRTYPMATGFLANSSAVRSRVCELDGLAPDRIRVIENGVDPERYRFAEHPEAVVAVGLVGNLNRPVKRADLFLRAAARVGSRHPEVIWHLIGGGELRERYESQAAELGIAGRCVFAGRVSDVASYLQKIAVGVICSDSEGLSNAVLEYMLSGCAVVATAVGGNLETIEDGRTGLLVPPRDETALEAAISRLIESRDLRLRLARQARAIAERRYGWERCAAEHQEHYSSLLRAALR